MHFACVSILDQINIVFSNIPVQPGPKIFNTARSKFYVFNPCAPGDFAEKRVLKLVEWLSGHCCAIKS